MNLEELSSKSGISQRRLKDLNSHGLIHSPIGGLWPEENIDLIERYAGSRQKKWIHKASMRRALIQGCIRGGNHAPDHTITEKELTPECLLLGTEVLSFTKNDKAAATIDEVISEYLLMIRTSTFFVPQHCVVKALVLLSDGYSPCWIRDMGGGVRTTIDMMGGLTTMTPVSSGTDMAMGVYPVFESACESLGIKPFKHPVPKHPDALLTSKEGENWFEYAVFRDDDSGKTMLEPIGVLL